eukprot:GHVQ01026535.1.p1 GENE.GHVQ01026535.1~~GHVQ01026535.1.p1  ORF type:complete len:183 (-),score=40.91 GHVQ01026535.1:210-758(-)
MAISHHQLTTASPAHPSTLPHLSSFLRFLSFFLIVCLYFHLHQDPHLPALSTHTSPHHSSLLPSLMLVSARAAPSPAAPPPPPYQSVDPPVAPPPVYTGTPPSSRGVGKTVQPEEMEDYKRDFLEFDLNKDGLIDAYELRMSFQNDKVDHEELFQFFMDVDSDDTGTVTEEEYLDYALSFML